MTAVPIDVTHEPAEQAPLHVPPDHGCPDLARFDRRFARCTSCPLPRCRDEYPVGQQQSVTMLVQRVLRGAEPRAVPSRPRDRAQWRLHRALVEAISGEQW